MEVFKGITASPGLAMGTACLYSETTEADVPHYVIERERVDNEIARLGEARAKAKDAMRQMIQAAEQMGDKRAGEIFNAHLMVLDDPVLNEKMTDLIRTRFVNAEHAASDAFEAYIDAYQTKDLHFAELAHDIMDVRNRLLSSFSDTSGHFECPEGERHAVVVVSKRLTPSMVLHIPRQHVLAFVTEEGGLTTHAMILARSYNVPVVFGVDVEHACNCGDRVIVDALQGTVIVAPDTATTRQYADKIKDIERKRQICDVKKSEPSVTRKKKRIQLKVNISTPGEIDLVTGLHYDGIGLLRTEFLFLNKAAPPSEDEQFAMYKHIIDSAEGRHIVIRLLDVGCDKMPGYLHLPSQDNPDLGIRGARALDFFFDVYLAQTKAILRAAAFGEVRLLYPMVADAGDIQSFRALTANAKALLKKEGKQFRSSIKEGIMIETPAAAVMARSLLAMVDFANIGSNDLLQYTLAAGRGNLAVEKRYHILHPALARLIEFVVKAGRYHKKEVCLCGEIASFESFYPLLLGLGLRSFSVAASKVADIKCELLHLTKPPQSLIQRFYTVTTKKDLDALFLS